MSTSGDVTFRFRDIALAAYGPTIVSSIGHGAVLPVLAMRARDLGADVSDGGLVVAVLGVGQLVATLPSGALVARVGERRALFAAGLVDACAMAVAALTALGRSGWRPASCSAGCAGRCSCIARQGFMIDAVPPTHRARALSTLGGSYRVGVLVGPLLGAGLIAVTG